MGRLRAALLYSGAPARGFLPSFPYAPNLGVAVLRQPSGRSSSCLCPRRSLFCWFFLLVLSRRIPSRAVLVLPSDAPVLGAGFSPSCFAPDVPVCIFGLQSPGRCAGWRLPSRRSAPSRMLLSGASCLFPPLPCSNLVAYFPASTVEPHHLLRTSRLFPLDAVVGTLLAPPSRSVRDDPVRGPLPFSPGRYRPRNGPIISTVCPECSSSEAQVHVPWMFQSRGPPSCRFDLSRTCEPGAPGHPLSWMVHSGRWEALISCSSLDAPSLGDPQLAPG